MGLLRKQEYGGPNPLFPTILKEVKLPTGDPWAFSKKRSCVETYDMHHSSSESAVVEPESKHVPFAFNTSTVIAYYRETPLKYRVLVVWQKNDPFKGRFALPGGFQEVDEPLTKTANREFYEETGIRINVGVGSDCLVCVQSNPKRDTRGQIIDHVYATEITLEDILRAKAGDDAADLDLVEVDISVNQKNYITAEWITKFAFDHADSLNSWIEGMKKRTMK